MKDSTAAEEKRLKALWGQKNAAKPFEAFYKWYMKQDQKCHYCGITEQQIAELDQAAKQTAGKPLTKSKKGKHLEIERKSPNKGYDDFKNLALACHWCNNAKTDTFTEAEFKKVGKVFAQIWKERLKGNTRS